MNLLKEFGLNDIKSVFRQTDKILLLLSIALSVFGALMVCTATFDGESYLSRDTVVMFIALALGVVASLIISLIDYDIIYKLWPLIAGGCLLLMFLSRRVIYPWLISIFTLVLPLLLLLSNIYPA